MSIEDHYRQQEARQKQIDDAYLIAQHNYRVALVGALVPVLLRGFATRPPREHFWAKAYGGEEVLCWRLIGSGGIESRYYLTTSGEIHVRGGLRGHGNDPIDRTTLRTFTIASTLQEVQAQDTYNLRLITYALEETLTRHHIPFDRSTWLATYYPDGLFDKAGYRPPGRYGQTKRKGFFASLFG